MKALPPLAVSLLFLGCRSAPPAAPPTEGPYAVVPGAAQDGGLPRIGCDAACCRRARREPGARRPVAPLLVVDPRGGRRWLVDATPDLPPEVRARVHFTHPNRSDPVADPASAAAARVEAVGMHVARELDVHEL